MASAQKVVSTESNARLNHHPQPQQKRKYSYDGRLHRTRAELLVVETVGSSTRTSANGCVLCHGGSSTTIMATAKRLRPLNSVFALRQFCAGLQARTSRGRRAGLPALIVLIVLYAGAVVSAQPPPPSVAAAQLTCLPQNNPADCVAIDDCIRAWGTAAPAEWRDPVARRSKSLCSLSGITCDSSTLRIMIMCAMEQSSGVQVHAAAGGVL